MGDDGATTEPDLELLLLGSTEVRLVGEPIEIGAKKLRVLLALLGAAGAEGVSTDALIEDVWEEDPPSGARATLHAYVSNVRRLLGATAIVTTSVGYRLGQHVHCDLHEFDRLRGFRSHPVDLAAAQRLWRGEFAADARPHLALDAVATRLAEARTEVRIANAAAALETGAPGAVVGELRELIDEAPYDETPVALLMRALYRAGRAVEAGRVFQDFRRRLGDDIGVDPSDELVELEIAVLNGELSSETDHTSQLDEPSRSDSVPQPLDNMFVDEDGNAERLGEAIAKNRLVSLLGVGGVGKTRLVQEWLHSGGLSEHTAVFVNLNDFEEHEAQQAVDAVAGTVRRAADRSCLSLVLVLDNCEHLLGAVAAATERMLSENARLKVVATSRVRLGLSHEVVMRIDPLSCEAKRNEPSDACRLLSARIEAFGTRAAVSAPRAMEDLVRSLDGIPLDIEMAAYNVNTLGIEAFSSDSPEAFDLMSDTSTMAGGRRRSLDDTIPWSWERLSGETQILLRSLSELRGTFDLSTARIVGKAGGVYTDRHLVALAEASLIGSRSSASTSSKGGVAALCDARQCSSIRPPQAWRSHRPSARPATSGRTFR
jgi:DNA-binding SARP family transcriptional activator/predicted ATPase